MRKETAIRIVLAALAILTISIFAQGQTQRTYTAEIPFDFVLGNNTYDAGSFEVVLERPNYLANILTLRDGDKTRLERIAISSSANRTQNKKTILVFDHYEHGYVLREIVGPAFGFKAPKPSESVWVYISGNPRVRPETVAVVLNAPDRRDP